MKKTILFPGILVFLAAFTRMACGAEETLSVARMEAANGHYDVALALVGDALQIDPKDTEARLLQAQVHGWQENYSLAESELDDLLADDPTDADVFLTRGNLYYAENKLDAASRNFDSALILSPDYQDARDGRDLAQKAKQDSAHPYAWQADIGSEYSTFVRTPQSPWNNEFVQLTRQFPDSGTALHVQLQRYHEFAQTDMYVEIGADQRFTPWSNGYLYVGGTPDPAFRPLVHAASGGNIRFGEVSPITFWGTLDSRYDDYPAVQVGNVNPGLRGEFADNWALSGMFITVEQSNAETAYGWEAKLDGQVEEGWRFYLGYADAPETEAGVTVRTQTVFTGTAYDINPANTILFGYTRDDRDNSYIRHAFDASLSHRF